MHNSVSNTSASLHRAVSELKGTVWEKTLHPRIAELANVLIPLIKNAPARPTQRDRNALMRARDAIRDLCNEPGIKLNVSDEDDRRYLYVEATRLANRQEKFWEQNGCKYEAIPYAQMTDDEARDAIGTCIHRRLRPGVAVADIHAALKDEVGATGVALGISPQPVNGRLPSLSDRERFQFQFMANGPSGAII